MQSSRQRGYAFLILMMVLTILLITLTAAVPNVLTEGRREKEEELIFRGEQYARAIALFHRQFNRYPTSIKELLKRTNGYRFLRHAYPDPMTQSGKWRLIHATAQGVVTDSLTLLPLGSKKNKNEKSGNSGQSSREENNQGSGDILQLAGENGRGNQGTTGTGQGAGASSQGSSMTSQNGKQELQGAFVVGVASTSTKKSIRVFNDQDHYNMWEFLGIPTNSSGGTVLPGAGQPGTPQSQGGGMMSSPSGNSSKPQ